MMEIPITYNTAAPPEQTLNLETTTAELKLLSALRNVSPPLTQTQISALSNDPTTGAASSLVNTSTGFEMLNQGTNPPSQSQFKVPTNLVEHHFCVGST